VVPRILPAFITSGLIILVTSSIIILCINELYSKRMDPQQNRFIPTYTSGAASILRHFLRIVSNYLLAMYLVTAVIFLVRELPNVLAGRQQTPVVPISHPILSDGLFDAYVIVMFALSIVLVTVILRWYIYVRRREA
jgi:hypothetical protein